MSDGKPPLERLLDLAVFAPLGMITAVRDELPRFSQQGRQVFHNRVVLARFIGQMAVQQGQRELARRVEARRAGQPAVSEPDVASVRVDVHVPTDDSGAVPSADELPIDGYESVPAINVVQRLSTLRADEVEAIRRFEQAHRARRTILAKIDQLQAERP